MIVIPGKILNGNVIVSFAAINKAALEINGDFDVIVCERSKSITERQKRTYWRLVGQASAQTGYTKHETDYDWRIRFGREFFEVYDTELSNGKTIRELSSLTSLSVDEMSHYLRNIIHGSAEDGVILTEPDFMRRTK